MANNSFGELTILTMLSRTYDTSSQLLLLIVQNDNPQMLKEWHRLLDEPHSDPLYLLDWIINRIPNVETLKAILDYNHVFHSYSQTTLQKDWSIKFSELPKELQDKKTLTTMDFAMLTKDQNLINLLKKYDPANSFQGQEVLEVKYCAEPNDCSKDVIILVDDQSD